MKLFLTFFCRGRGDESQTKNNLETPHVVSYKVLVLLALVLCGNIFAADVTADFTAANKFYAEGKFSDAATAYEKILGTGARSPALLFNYANAEFKSGKLGKAIDGYHRAALLAPRDAEIRANLTFVRNQVQGVTLHESRWLGWLGFFSFDEWTIFTAAAFWLTFILLAAKQIRPALAARLKNVLLVFAGLTIFLGAMLCVQAANHFFPQTAVVVEAQVTARSGPFDDAQTAFAARDGAELRVLERHDDWIQVANGAGKIGWLNKKQIEILPGA